MLDRAGYRRICTGPFWSLLHAHLCGRMYVQYLLEWGKGVHLGLQAPWPSDRPLTRCDARTVHSSSLSLKRQRLRRFRVAAAERRCMALYGPWPLYIGFRVWGCICSSALCSGVLWEGTLCEAGVRVWGYSCVSF